jgi:hypothetical protein
VAQKLLTHDAREVSPAARSKATETTDKSRSYLRSRR